MATVHQQSRPRKLGNYEILQEIGQGGMGVIYLARQPALDRQIVLKKMRRELLIDSSMIERFQREARAAAQVHHQNVVAVYDCFDFRGDHFIAQELVEGPDLSSILGHTSRLDARVAAVIALEIMRGLEEVHARGIVHRDLKPANILIGCNGETKIADFGIALGRNLDGLTQPGTLVGSVPYMSPEQMLGKQIDYRSDLFSFGVMLYEMLVGEPPFMAFEDDTTATLLERIEKEEYDPPRRRVKGIPRYLARLTRACLRSNPARRTQTAMQIRRQLERRLGGLSPADCRHEIVQHLRACDVFSGTDNRAANRYAPSVRRSSRFRRFGWAIPAAVAIVTIGVGMTRESNRHASNVRLLPPPDQASAAAAPKPARLRVAAYPWAEVRLEDGTRFHTPRAAALEVATGRHTIVFEHPKYGTAEVVVDIDAGENRLVHHVFEGVPRP